MNNTGERLRLMRQVRQYKNQSHAEAALARIKLHSLNNEEVSDIVYATKFLVARLLGPTTVIEIGVRAGYAAVMFCEACPGVKYLGIDNDSDTYWGIKGSINHARQLLEPYPSAEIVVADSQLMTTLSPTKVDMVHVDADHSYAGTLHDLMLAGEVTDLILVDDYRNVHYTEVGKATDYFTSIQSWDTIRLDERQALLVRGM